MADWPTISIDRRLVSVLLAVAQEQERLPVEVVQEALLRYFRELGVHVELDWDIDIAIDAPRRRTHAGQSVSLGHPPEVPIDALFQLIDQEQRERGVEPLSEEEAMRIASEELHAMRREGGTGSPQKAER
jgi:hypothetical protein